MRPSQRLVSLFFVNDVEMADLARRPRGLPDVLVPTLWWLYESMLDLCRQRDLFFYFFPVYRILLLLFFTLLLRWLHRPYQVGLWEEPQEITLKREPKRSGWEHTLYGGRRRREIYLLVPSCRGIRAMLMEIHRSAGEKTFAIFAYDCVLRIVAPPPISSSDGSPFFFYTTLENFFCVWVSTISPFVFFFTMTGKCTAPFSSTQHPLLLL